MQISIPTLGKQDVNGLKKLSEVHILHKNIHVLKGYNENTKRKRISYERGPKESMMSALALTILIASILNTASAILQPSPYYVNKLQLYTVRNSIQSYFN